MTATFNPCALIPVYNHHQVLAETVEHLRQLNLTVLLIDDGSSEQCLKVERTLADNQHVYLVEHPHNLGKGAAIKTGLRKAIALGFSHVLQVDADGQHNLEDAPALIDAARKHPSTLISGHPVYDDSVPKHRFYGRYATHVWVWINTLSFDIIDSMCGYRVYPAELSCQLIEQSKLGNRMDFDTEIMVRWHWHGHSVKQLPTHVSYPKDGISHFAPWRDNLMISWMHTKLFFGMLIRLPTLLVRKLRGTGSEVQHD